ncbi:hypothetical protein LTR36_007462 [Oleoguttula mirabilis]|uniref:BAG domain-containing protein n=1 Tax=Oleoguttula mirabilis TaxID=1507867 RepID=A0AAV9J9T6_9PEZI|nr:hypothetical protein LTR36_007462 [Oleoguttula mirabilis]
MAGHPLTVANVASFNILESVHSTLGNLSTLLPANFNSSAAIAYASKAVEQFFSGPPPAPPPETANTWQDQLNGHIATATDFVAGRTTLENTSILLALCTFVILAMSWGTRIGNLGRFSPFTRSPPQGSTRVSDADFSYITADDLRKHNADSGPSHSHHHHQQRAESPVEYGPPRDTDVLVLKNKKREYPVHFPAYAIAKGELTVGHVREQAAKKTSTADPRRIKLLFRGKNLKDDARTCKAEGLREGDQLMLTIADSMPSASGSDDDDDDETSYADGGDQQTGGDGEARRRRNRGKKSKRKAKRDQTSGTSTPADQAPSSNLGVPHSQSSTRAPSPRPTPTTALGKIEAIRERLGEFLPQADAFLHSPPTDPSKKDFEHKKLSETILAQVLLKLDAVETEGDPEARQRRKDLVRETQQVLQDLDAEMKR